MLAKLRLVTGVIGRLGQFAFHVEFPAVVQAADAVVFVTAQRQRGFAVRALLVNHPGCAVGYPKSDEVLTQQTDAQKAQLKIGTERALGNQRRSMTLELLKVLLGAAAGSGIMFLLGIAGGWARSPGAGQG